MFEVSDIGDYKTKLDQLTRIGNDLARWASSQYKSKKVTLVQQKDITGRASELLGIVGNLRMEVSHMAGRLSERLNIEKTIQEERVRLGEPRVPTFAEALKA